jgi:hypothetical protein
MGAREGWEREKDGRESRAGASRGRRREQGGGSRRSLPLRSEQRSAGQSEVGWALWGGGRGEGGVGRGEGGGVVLLLAWAQGSSPCASRDASRDHNAALRGSEEGAALSHSRWCARALRRLRRTAAKRSSASCAKTRSLSRAQRDDSLRTGCLPGKRERGAGGGGGRLLLSHRPPAR